MADEKLPMDDVQEAPPPETTEQREERVRDESGRFAPKQDAEHREPVGKPNAETARRREAQERDDARRERDEAKQARDALQKRFDDMSKIARGEEEQQKPDPLQQVTEKLDAIDKRFTARDEQDQAAQIDQQVRQYSDADEQRFRQQAPDFPNAVQHYIQSRLTEMQAFGIDQAQAEQQLGQEAQTLLYRCAQAGSSPAETLYKMAQARGYQPGNVTPFQQRSEPMQQARPTGGRSLGTGGGAPGNGLTAQQIGNMSDDDYFELRKTPEGQRAIKRAMGG